MIRPAATLALGGVLLLAALLLPVETIPEC